MSNEYEYAKRRRLMTLFIFLFMPIIIILGFVLWKNQNYHLIAILLAILTCVPFFVAYEGKRPKARELILISTMSAIAVVGRVVFAFVPGFKPVTAVTVITGMSLGPEAGFFTGAMSALVSNLFFGQGPWTPFQMMAWGLIGFLAGILGKIGLMKYPLFFCLYGILSGAIFSLTMDIWVVLSIDRSFQWSRYWVTVAASLPTMLLYMGSNLIFLLLLTKPITKKLERIQLKYGIG